MIYSLIQALQTHSLLIQVISISLLFLLLRRLVREYMKKWLGEHFEKDDAVDQSKLNTKVFWIVYGIIIWLLLKNSNIYSDVVLLFGNYNFFNSEYFVLSIYTVLSVFVVGYVLYIFLQLGRGLLKLSQRHNSDYFETIDSLINHVGLGIIFVILLFVAGVSWKIIVPVVSALGIGIGFGLQEIVHNITSGILLLTSQEIKPGDQITVTDKMGKVVSIGLRSSVVNTLDNVDVIIPNSQLTGNQITNWSYRSPAVRVSLPVGVAYKSDVTVVTQALLDATKTCIELLKNPEPDVLFVGFGDSSLQFQVRVWVNVKKHPLSVIKSKINHAIWDSLKANNIEIPFPQQDIWFKNELPGT